MKKSINYKKYIKRFEIIIISGTILFSVICLTAFMLIPNFKKAKLIYDDQFRLKKRLENLKKKDNELSALDMQYYSSNFPKIDLVLPQTKDYVSLFSTFDNLEQKNNVKISRTDLQFGVVSTSSGRLVRDPVSSAYIIPIGVDISGEVSAVKNFMKSLSDYSGRLMLIEDIRWRKTDDITVLSMTGKAYYFPLATTLGNLDAPLTKISSNQDKIMTKIAELELAQDESAEFDKANIGKKDLFQ